MSKKVDFKLDIKGLNELMKGPAMQSELQSKGQQVEAAARGMCPKGEYQTRTVTGRWIATTFVSVENYEAMQDSYENNTLLKALHGGGKG